MAALAGTGYRAEMKIQGTIRRSELEGGLWVLQTEGGDQYQLTGKTDGVKDGMKAEVEGNVDKQAMGFGMVGAHFAVHKLTALA